ncbi:MAG: hypothetical protein QNL04_12800 [SAR324 cluster bacterium]|nr:hypothetical protein [SAR324 cluster bacterium]
MLNSEDNESLSELKSTFLLCKDRSAFASAMTQLQQLLGNRHWSAALCEMEGDHTVTSNYVFMNNFPSDFMESYTLNQAEFFDVIVSNHFCEDHFGKLQYWADTFKKTQDEKGSIPEKLYKMHIQWREFLEEWGILLEGYSIGRRTFIDKTSKWSGSIINYADDLEFSERNQEIIEKILESQHIAVLNILQPELTESSQKDQSTQP